MTQDSAFDLKFNHSSRLIFTMFGVEFVLAIRKHSLTYGFNTSSINYYDYIKTFDSNLMFGESNLQFAISF